MTAELERIDNLTQPQLYGELERLVARCAAGEFDTRTARTIAELQAQAQRRDGLTSTDTESLRGILARVADRDGHSAGRAAPTATATKFGPAWAAAIFARRRAVEEEMRRRRPTPRNPGTGDQFT